MYDKKFQREMKKMVERTNWSEVAKEKGLVRKYPDGYKPKIEYWQDKVNEAIDLMLPEDEIKRRVNKVLYFISREQERIANL